MLINDLPISIRTKDKLGSPDFIKLFRKQFPIEQLSMRSCDIGLALEELGAAMVELMLEEDASIDLPYNLGSLYIVTKHQKFQLNEDGTPKYLKIDYPSTYKAWENNPEMKETKQYVYFVNNDLTYNSFKWCKRNIKLQNTQYYAFDPARGPSRKLAAISKTGKRYAGEQKTRIV